MIHITTHKIINDGFRNFSDQAKHNVINYNAISAIIIVYTLAHALLKNAQIKQPDLFYIISLVILLFSSLILKLNGVYNFEDLYRAHLS